MEFDAADQLDVEWHSIFQKHLKNLSCHKETQILLIEDAFKKIYCPDPNDGYDVKEEDKEICEKCLIEAITLLSGRRNLPRQTQIRFLLNIGRYTFKEESSFINLNASNTLHALICISEPSAEIQTKLLFLEFLNSFLEHSSGIKWLLETSYWTEILSLTINYGKLNDRILKIGCNTMKILLKKAFAMDEHFSEEIIMLIVRPILRTSKEIESVVLETSHMLDGLKPNITCLVEILEDLLENHNTAILHDIMDRKVCNACQIISERSTDMGLCLNCDRISIILSFFGLTKVFDGIKCIKEDPLVLSGFVKIIDREVSKGLFTVVFELYYYALKYYKCVSEKFPQYYINEKPVSPETQLVALQLEPILLEWARLDGATDITKVDDNVDIAPMSHPMKIFKKLCFKTLGVGFKVKEKLPLRSFDMYSSAVGFIMRSKDLYSKNSLCEIVDSFVYSLEAPLRYLQSKKGEEVQIEDEQQIYILTLHEAILLFIESFNLYWHDSFKILDLLYIVIEGASSYQWIEPVMLDSLILLEKLISKHFSPSMTLLIDTDDGLKNIGPLLYKICSTNRGKIRIAVLEVVHTIALNANICFSTFKKILLDASLPSLLSTMVLNDESISVKATALKCLQQIIVWDAIDDILPTNTLINTVLDMLKKYKDQAFRKEAIKFIDRVYQHEKYVDKDVMNIYNCLEQLALADDSEGYVQKELVEFWRGVVKKYLSKQGWTDLTLPTVTFSKRIISLTPKEVQKKYYKALSELSRMGALNALEKFWEFNSDHIEAKESSLHPLKEFNFGFINNEITVESMLFIEESLDLPLGEFNSLTPQQGSKDILQDINKVTMNRMMHNNLELANIEELFTLLDTSHLNKNGPQTEEVGSTSEITRHLSPSKFVELVYKKFNEVNPPMESHYIQGQCREKSVFVVDSKK